MHFDLIHSDLDSKARAGILHTDHGDIETPIFLKPTLFQDHKFSYLLILKTSDRGLDSPPPEHLS